MKIKLGRGNDGISVHFFLFFLKQVKIILDILLALVIYCLYKS